jgi:hypothetical protein
MTKREEWRQARVARLLDQVQAAARSWAEAEYAAGLQDGRSGTASAHVENRRSTAERRFTGIAARLSAAVNPPNPSQRRLPLA